MRTILSTGLAAVLLFFAAAPRIHAASQEKAELNQLKADIKTFLATHKTNIAATMDNFNTSMKAMQDAVKNGVLSPLSDIPHSVAENTIDAVVGIDAANRGTLANISNAVLFDLTIPSAQSTYTGGFGVVDDARAKMQKEQAKAFKKIQATLKKIVKTMPKTSSGTYAISAVLLPPPDINSVIANENTSLILPTPVPCASILAAGSSGDVVMAGLAPNGVTVNVLLGAGFFPTVGAGNFWYASRSGVTPGDVVVGIVTDADFDVNIGFNGIYVPVSP